MAAARYLVAVEVVTAGRDGDDLGSDERPIVLIALAAVDLSNDKVIAVEQRLVKPCGMDLNDNPLPEIRGGQYGLNEEASKSGKPLEYVIEQFDHFVESKLDGDFGRSFRFVTDGQLHLRQALHPEACRKNIRLPDYYYSFFDLKKEFHQFYRTIGRLSIPDMLGHLGMEADRSAEPALGRVQNMAKIILRLRSDGHQFEEPEIVDQRLEPGICSKNEEVDSETVVRARGLPWQSSDQDVATFFRGLNIVRGGVALCLSPQGRRNGEALVRFMDQEHRDLALRRHKHHIGQRYIEVYRATGKDFIDVAGGNNNEAQDFLSRGGQVIIRMRGLPYDCTASEVTKFFSYGHDGCQVMGNEQGVLFVKKPDGRSTGDAFVLFETEEQAVKALTKHRKDIGTRYIELFRSTTAEVQQVLNRSMDPKTYDQSPQPLISNLPQAVSILPNQLLPSISRKDCIRLRGLPYEAQVEHILEFLGEFAKNIVLQGVHMVYNAQAQPSGEAFIQMDSEHSAYMAAHHRHHRYMIYGKKQRYIEVFQCSSDDMNLLITGGLPIHRSLLSPGNNVMSAGYNSYPYVQPTQILPASVSPRIPAYYPSIIYWPYPSPPVSPTAYYPHSTQTVLSTDCLQIHKNSETRQNEESFSSRNVDERGIQEKNKQDLGRRYIEVFMA